MSAGLSKAEVTKAFKAIDTDNSGSISVSEVENLLKKVYGTKCDPAKAKSEAEAFVKDLDKNHDGKLTLDELLKYFGCQ